MKSEGLTKIDTINNYFFRVPQEYLFNTRIRGLPHITCHSVNCTSETELFLGIDLSSGFDLEVSSNESKQVKTVDLCQAAYVVSIQINVVVTSLICASYLPHFA